MGAGADLRLELPPGTNPVDVLSTCAEAIRSNRVIDFCDVTPPRGASATTVLINFGHIVGAWVEPM